MGSVEIVANDRLDTWYDKVKYLAIVRASCAYVENMCEKFVREKKLTPDAGAYYKGKYTKEIESYSAVIKRSYILAGGRVESLIRVLAKCIRGAFNRRARELNLGSYLSLYINALEKITASISGTEEINERLRAGEAKNTNAEETKSITQTQVKEEPAAPIKEEPKPALEEPVVAAAPSAADIARERLERINSQLETGKTDKTVTLEERTKKLVEKENLEKVISSQKAQGTPAPTAATIKPAPTAAAIKPAPKPVNTAPQAQKTVQQNVVAPQTATMTLEQKVKQMEATQSAVKPKVQEAKKTTVGSATGGLNDISRLKSLTDDKK